jgi:hypothetical protein
MEIRMISRFKSFVMPVTLAVVAAAFMGCAGSKSSSSSSMDSSMSAEPSKNQKLEDARRSAEEAEMKAHQLRTDKNNTASKSGK